MSALPTYELYAIRYATREARRAEHFIGGDPHDGPMAMDYFVWVAISPERTILVDLGFSAESAAKRMRTFLGCPIDALRSLDVDPSSIKDVVLTHLHYDHAGNSELLPEAQFHLQEAEMHFATGRNIRYRYFAHGFDPDDICAMVRLNFARRMRLYDGPFELAAGISLIPAPGHSAGQQVVRVHTQRGFVVLASDATHYYENIRRHRPHVAAVSVVDVLHSYDTVLKLAGGLENLIPGHDPMVMALYPAARPGLEGRIARLDVPPKEIPLAKAAKALA